MSREYRTKVILRLEPEGTDEPTRTFALFRDELHQSRGPRSGQWATDYTHPQTTLADCLADGITRRQLVKLIEDGADMLLHAEAMKWEE